MESLGINITNLFIYSVLFIVVFLIINKFFLNTIIDILEKRKKDISSTLGLKQELEQNKTTWDEEKDKLLSEIKEDRKKTIQEALESAKKERIEIIARAKNEAEEIIIKTNKRLEMDKQKLEVDFELKVQKTAQEIVNRVYKSNKIEIDKEIIKTVIDKL